MTFKWPWRPNSIWVFEWIDCLSGAALSNDQVGSASHKTNVIHPVILTQIVGFDISVAS